MKFSKLYFSICLAAGMVANVYADEIAAKPPAVEETLASVQTQNSAPTQSQMLTSALGSTGYVCGVGTNIPAGKYFSYIGGSLGFSSCGQGKDVATVYWTDLFDGATIMFPKDLKDSAKPMAVTDWKYMTYTPFTVPVEHWRYTIEDLKNDGQRGCNIFVPIGWIAQPYTSSVGCGGASKFAEFYRAVKSSWDVKNGATRLSLSAAGESVTKIVVRLEVSGTGVSDSSIIEYLQKSPPYDPIITGTVSVSSFPSKFEGYARSNANFKFVVTAYEGSRLAYNQAFEKSGFDLLGIKPPSMSLTVSSQTVLEGEPVSRVWSSQNTDYCTSKTGDRLATSGNWATVPLYASNTFQISCTGPGGTVSQSAYVQVIPKPILTLDVQPRQIKAGQTVTRTWSSQNADYCTSKTGERIATSGSVVTVPLYASNTFQNSCTGPGGTVTQSVDVTVVP